MSTWLFAPAATYAAPSSTFDSIYDFTWMLSSLVMELFDRISIAAKKSEK